MDAIRRDTDGLAPIAAVDGLSGSADEVSVVVCTRDRPDLLRSCIEGLVRLRPTPMEIVVVNNSPYDGHTARVVGDFSSSGHDIRYLREAQRGASRAKNKGLAAVRGRIVAFTDDDVRVDPPWIRGLLRGFARRADVACVTGMVATERLDYPAEKFFDARVSWSDSCEPAVFDLHSSASPFHPYAASAFGTGANMAFLTDALRDIKGFDESLGPGRPTRGGEDLDTFVRMLRANHALAYEPSALVWHRHRSDPAALRSQMFGYGTGLTGYLTKFLTSGTSAADLIRMLPRGLRHMRAEVARTKSPSVRSQLPRFLSLAEVIGWVYGPVAYVRSQRTVHRDRRRELRP